MKHALKFLILGASLLYVGCGAAPASPEQVASAPLPAVATVLPVTTTACPSGQFNIGWGCFPAPDFQTACYYGGGQPVQASGSTVMACRTVFNGSARVSGSGLPMLPTGDVAGIGAWNTGLALRAGDKLEFLGTGGWGSSSVSVKRRLGGLFTTYSTSYDCDQVNLNGVSDDGIAATNQSEPAALYATDGTERFLLGSSATKQIINGGTLKLGFNSPPVTNGCSTLTISRLRITRCMDTNANTYTCQ